MPDALVSPIVRWLAAGALLLLVAGWALAERGGRIQARAEVATRDQLLATNTAALADLRKDRDRTVAALEAAAAGQRAAAAALQSVRSAAHAAPPSSACVAHPAARALRDSLRAGAAAGGASGAAAAAGQPHGAMPGTAVAR